MRSAIKTTYRNRNGQGYVVAKAEGLKAKSCRWDHSLPVEENHRAAAAALAARLDWPFERYAGGWFGDVAFWVDTLKE